MVAEEDNNLGDDPATCAYERAGAEDGVGTPSGAPDGSSPAEEVMALLPNFILNIYNKKRFKINKRWVRRDVKSSK